MNIKPSYAKCVSNDSARVPAIINNKKLLGPAVWGLPQASELAFLEEQGCCLLGAGDVPWGELSIIPGMCLDTGVFIWQIGESRFLYLETGHDTYVGLLWPLSRKMHATCSTEKISNTCEPVPGRILFSSRVTQTLFSASLLAENCVLLKSVGKYHIVCENQTGSRLKICNLDSIPGLATDSC